MNWKSYNKEGETNPNCMEAYAFIDKSGKKTLIYDEKMYLSRQLRESQLAAT